MTYNLKENLIWQYRVFEQGVKPCEQQRTDNNADQDLVLAPVVAGLLIIYFCIRRSAADEMDQKKWNSRIVTAIVSCIGAVIGSATLGIIVGYYK